MKLSAVDIYPLRIPLKGSFANAHQTKTFQESIVVRIKTADGLTGAGNVDPDPGHSEETCAETLSAVRTLAPLLVGLDPFNTALCLETMDRAVSNRLDAKAVLEMALLDVKGKALQVPVHSLLGGAVKQEIHLNGWVGMLAPEEAAREAHHWSDLGFRSMKIKVGSGVDGDRDRLAAVRAAVGPKMQLRVDANEGYGVDEAIRLARAMAPYDIAIFEQPVARRDLAGMAAVRRAIDIPVMADESIVGPDTLIEVIKQEAADLIKVKVMKQGGLYRTAAMIHMAEAAGLRCVLGHGFGLTINTLAELHVAASAGNVIDGVECVGPLKMQGDVVADPIRMTSGSVPVPDGPGLGAELSEDRLAAWQAPASEAL